MSIAYRVNNVARLFSEGIDAEGEPAPLRLRSSRERLFGEGPARRFARALNVAATLSQPRRMVALPAYLELLIRDRMVGAAALPDPRSALDRPTGYCGAAGDLAPTTLLQAYAQGLHCRAPIGPASWWSPPMRFLRDLREPPAPEPVATRFDQDCDGIVARCARAALGRDALESRTPALKHAHARLLDRGYAHAFSIERACGYGVVVGRIFVVLGLSGATAELARCIDGLDAELRRRHFATLDLTFVRDGLPNAHGFEATRDEYLAMLDANPEADNTARWR